MAHVDWQKWHTAAFLEAQRRRRPVLLLLDTAWSPACAQAHEVVFARPDVAGAIAASAIAIRVDADRRPDIADRYGLGHWPSLLVLTPEGQVLTGGTYLDASLASWLTDVARAFAAGDGHWSVPDAAADAPAPLDAAPALTAIAEAIRASRDASTGACRHDGQPSAGAALFALAQAAVAVEPEWAAVAADTIDALAAASPDVMRTGLATLVPPAGEWEAVARLEDQAEWTRVLARAVRLEPLPEWRALLDALVRGLQGFRRPDGLWRPWIGLPAGLGFVDASARACRALLTAAEALERPDLAADAIEALEALTPLAYARASGVAHVLEDGRARGPMLLDDAMLLAHALLDADAWRGDRVYADLAEELLRTALARAAHPSGALVDRVATMAGAGQVGRLAEAHLPLVGNAEAARLLCRLFPGEATHAATARRLLSAVSVEAAAAGALGAPVGLAWHAVGSAGATVSAW